MPKLSDRLAKLERQSNVEAERVTEIQLVDPTTGKVMGVLKVEKPADEPEPASVRD